MAEAEAKPKEQKKSKEVATQDEAAPEEEGPSYSEYDFPEEDAELDNTWQPVRPVHSSMAKQLSGSDGIGYAVRSYSGDKVEDNILSDQEFSEGWVPVPPAKAD